MVKKRKRQNELLNKDEGKITTKKTKCKRLYNGKEWKTNEFRQKERFQQRTKSLGRHANMNSNIDENSHNMKANC
jgi:hypothetical protein